MRRLFPINSLVLAAACVICGGAQFASTSNAIAAPIAGSISSAAQPGSTVPSAKLYDYVSYAVTNLPPHFKSAAVASTDITRSDNPITNAGASLGRVLFYDTQLSANNRVACGSCHTQKFGFADAQQFSEGFAGKLTKRHAMALTNARFYRRGRYFWDERAATLETQVLMPISDPVEMGSELRTLPAKLGKLSYYPPLFEAAFGTPEVTNDRIAKALAQFVRSLVSYQSKYDRAFSGGEPDFGAVFTDAELHGRLIFINHGCNLCHSTDAQTTVRIENNGLDSYSPDSGAVDGRFKAPSLRNIAVRQRFMHDGRFSSLDEVIEFYNSNVQDNPSLGGALRAPDGSARKMNLSEQDKADLKAFLETLTDEKFLRDPKFSNPF